MQITLLWYFILLERCRLSLPHLQPLVPSSARQYQPQKENVALSQGFSTHFRPWTTMPFQITLWTPVDKQNSHCSYGFFRHHGLYRWSATKVLLHKKIMWTPSIGHHGPSVVKPCSIIMFLSTNDQYSLKKLICGGPVLKSWHCGYQYKFFSGGDSSLDSENCNSFESSAFASAK